MRLGKYYLLRSLGRGGAAEVFLATDAHRAFFAVKRMLPHHSGNKRNIDRLISEARVTSLLEHRNIVRIYDLGVHHQDFYLAMEWIDGRSLDVLLARIKEKGQVLPPKALSHILRSVAAALDYAHDQAEQLIHRDVTPSNILIAYNGDVKLTDFCIAPGLGKLSYISPEQIRGENLDRRADVYSFGVVTCECFTLEKPFFADSAVELQQRIMNEPPKIPPSRLTPNLERAIQACLSKDRENRPMRAGDVCSVFDLPDREELARWMTALFSEERKHEAQELQEALSQFEPGMLSDKPPPPPPPETKTTDRDVTLVAFEDPSPVGIAKISLVSRLASKVQSKPQGAAPPAKQRRWRKKRKLWITMAAAVAAMVLGYTAFLAKPKPTVDLPFSGVITIVPTLEIGVTEAPSIDVKSIEAFFVREMRRHTRKKDGWLKLRQRTPIKNLKTISWTGSAFDAYRPFTQLKKRTSRSTSKGRAGGLIYIHFYPYTPETGMTYPIDFNGRRPKLHGLLFVPVSSSAAGETLQPGEIEVRLAHELCHVLGCTDKYDEAGHAIFPQGYVAPKAKVLHPQRFGELMTSRIPVSSSEMKPLTNLKHARIGDVTAKELMRSYLEATGHARENLKVHKR